ncbi:pyocin knob domain-containing protein [Thalassomonas haliotis]|uniref:Peptidase S74 domain-containing protein n=1 Tax=Thalassomonas haliotis TaxID=485448 RepID=A0ABY7VE01_9GAMM|nr:hypothetical protein [Thalassomonas haliotis]WDE11334.1 hypothetical protein H3N35_24450 [Thalassomonas haliotis]
MDFNQISFIVSPSVSVVNGSKIVTLTGGVDSYYVFKGTAIFIDGYPPVEGYSGTLADSSGKSVITLAQPWSHPDVINKPLVAFNAIEGLSEAIRRAREISGTTLSMLDAFESLVNSELPTVDVILNGIATKQVPYGYLAKQVQALIDQGDGAVDTLLALQAGVANLQGTVDSIQGDLDVSKNAAAASETAAKVSETKAKTSENNSKSSEGAASASAAAALVSENAAKASEVLATQKADDASASQLAAKSSETKVKTSQSNAKLSETKSKTSETSSAASAGDALASKTAAANSASAAALSASSAGDDAAATAADVLASQVEVVKAQQEVIHAKAEVAKAQAEVVNAAAQVGLAQNQVTLAGNARVGAETAKVAAETAQSAAESAEINVNAGVVLAQQYANHPEDIFVPGTTEYSAFHWKNKTKQLADGTAPDAFKLGGVEAGDYYHLNNKPNAADVGALAQASFTSADLGYVADLNAISDKALFCTLSGTYANSPLGSGASLTGQLMVIKRKFSAGFSVYQQLMVNDRIWWRRGTGSPLTWNEWAEFYHQGNKPTPADVGAAPSGEYLVKGANIANAADLNTYVATGLYHQNTNASAATGINFPTAKAGMLMVTADGDMVYQSYHSYNGQGLYHRTRHSGSWQPWDRLYDSGNKPTVTDIGALASTGGDLTGAINFLNDTGDILTLDGKSAIQRTTQRGGLAIGCDDTLILGSGESRNTLAANVNVLGEHTYIGSDFDVFVHTNLQNGWAERKAFKFGEDGDFHIGDTPVKNTLDAMKTELANIEALALAGL